jgi:hypothetical protein
LIKQNEIAFSNQIFDQILKRDEGSLQNDMLMDKKIFKVYRKDNDEEREDVSVNQRSNSNAKSLRSDNE